MEDREYSSHDYLDIAKQYQLIDDADNALLYLDKIEKDWYQKEQVFEMKIWAYEKLKDATSVTQRYKEWYEQRKISKAYTLRHIVDT